MLLMKYNSLRPNHPPAKELDIRFLHPGRPTITSEESIRTKREVELGTVNAQVS